MLPSSQWWWPKFAFLQTHLFLRASSLKCSGSMAGLLLHRGYSMPAVFGHGLFYCVAWLAVVAIVRLPSSTPFLLVFPLEASWLSGWIAARSWTKHGCYYVSSDTSLLDALYCLVRSGHGFLLPTLFFATLDHFSLNWPQWVCTAGQMCTWAAEIFPGVPTYMKVRCMQPPMPFCVKACWQPGDMLTWN